LSIVLGFHPSTGLLKPVQNKSIISVPTWTCLVLVGDSFTPWNRLKENRLKRPNQATCGSD
jgi:hypothetical protein